MDFNKLVKQNKANVRGIIRLITKEDNEDLEQEVYLRVWKNADKYKEQGSFKSNPHTANIRIGPKTMMMHL